MLKFDKLFSKLLYHSDTSENDFSFLKTSFIDRNSYVSYQQNLLWKHQWNTQNFLLPLPNPHPSKKNYSCSSSLAVTKLQIKPQQCRHTYTHNTFVRLICWDWTAKNDRKWINIEYACAFFYSKGLLKFEFQGNLQELNLHGNLRFLMKFEKKT